MNERDYCGTRLSKLKRATPKQRKLSRLTDFYVFHREDIHDCLGAVAYFVFLAAVLLLTAAYL